MVSRPTGLGRLRGLYFFVGTTAGLFVPYLSPFLEERGIRGGTQGTLFAMRTLLAIALGPLFGLAADRFGAGRALRVSVSLSGMAAGVLLLAGSLPGFAVAFVLLAAMATVAPLTDAAILGVLEKPGSRTGPEAFGRSRLYGSAGYAAAALLFGLWFRNATPDVTSWAAMLAICVLSVVTLGFAFALPHGGRGAEASFSDVPRLLRCPGVLLLLFIGALQWVTLSPYHSFFGAHLQHHSGGPAVIGLSLAVSVVVEIAAMATAARWVHRLSPGPVLAISAGAGVVRWTIVALGPPWAIVASQALHGLSYGIFFLAMMDAIVRRTPPELRGTATALIAAVAIGGGSLVGNLVAGQLYDIDQGRTLFLAAAAFSFAPALMALAVRGPAAARISPAAVVPE